MDKAYPFDFSVIIPVYNVAPFLREAVDSLIAQDLGFSRVQLILVDDGSTDGSAGICDEYAAAWPENVQVLHKPNGGVSSARNAGIPLAQGRYVNFMDADDMLTPDVLRLVYAFFTIHEPETDVVSIPVHFFDAKTGEHILNYKYKNGARVVDLRREWDHTQLAINSCFLKNDCVRELRFDEKLHHLEDGLFVQQVLMSRMTMGVVPAARYLYRKRSSGEASIVDKTYSDLNWYRTTLERYGRAIFDIARARCGEIPRFVQFSAMYELQWHISHRRIPAGLLSREEEEAYREAIRELLTQIDDEVILAQKNLTGPYLLHALRLKYGPALSLCAKGGGWVYAAGEKELVPAERFPIRLESLDTERDCFVLRGSMNLPEQREDRRVCVRIGQKCFVSETLCPRRGILSNGEELPYPQSFCVRIPLRELEDGRKLAFSLSLGGEERPLHAWSVGRFFPLSRRLKKAYCAKDGWLLRQSGEELIWEQAGRGKVFLREIAFLRELWKKHRRRAVLTRLTAHVYRKLHRRPLWLLSDRTIKAGDNGEAMLRYLIAEHPEIDCRFVIAGDCTDYARIGKFARVVDKHSRRYQFLLLVCDAILSSAVEPDVFALRGSDAPYRDLLWRRRFIFLQHGITQNDVSAWLRREKKNIYGFVTAAYPEREAIVKGSNGYEAGQIWLTGFPRFDRLYHLEAGQRQIAILPTWRKWLQREYDPDTGMHTLTPDIRESEYLKFFNGLLTDERLLTAAREHGYRIVMLPHPNLQPYPELFETNDCVTVLRQNCEYRDLYAASDLVLTDYSSAVFDFAYLRRPVLYTQFDKERFFGGEHNFKKGYFDYERDGFGEVEYDLDGTVSRLIEYMENGCVMKPKYRERADSFFAFHDQNNCRRVYEAIMARERDTEPQG